MVPRRAKKPRRVMQARVSSLVNIDGWFGMFFKPIVLDAPCSSMDSPIPSVEPCSPHPCSISCTRLVVVGLVPLH